MAAPLLSQSHDTQRKRVQLDANGGPPAKKSFVTQAWWAIKSMIPWGRNEDVEEGVITVEEEEEEEGDEEEGEDELDEEVLEEGEEEQQEEEEEEEELQVIDHEEEEDDDAVPLPLPNNVHRVPEVVIMDGSMEEEQVIIREVRAEEDVLIVETPEKTTIHTRRISPLSGAAMSSTPRVATLNSHDDGSSEVVVEVVATTPSCSSSPPFSPLSLPPTVTGLSPDVTTRVMEYVTEQSSRVVTAYSPSQSSTTSYDREKLRVGEEEETERGDSPLPEDSASRQVTPKSTIGVERNGYPAAKRDRWKKNDKRGKDPYRLVGQRAIGGNSSSISKRTTEKLPEKLRWIGKMNSHRHGESNFDENAKQRYMRIMEELAGRSSAMSSAVNASATNQPPLPFKFHTLNTRQKMGLEDHKKKLEIGKKMALDVLDDMFPRERSKEQSTEQLDVAGPSPDGTIVLDESSRDSSIRSPNSSNLSFHSVDKLTDLQHRMNEISLMGTSGRLQYDLYKESKADFDRTVQRLGEEGELRTKHRLETERLHHMNARTRLALQGIVIPEPEKLVDEFPQLSDEAEQLCRRAWTRGMEQEKFRGGDPPLTRKDLQTLYDANWLNDEVILGYMNLIVERSKNDKSLPKTYAFNTFFYGNISNRSKGFATVKRWTRKVDIFAHDVLLVPVHLSVHWTMAVVDVPAKTIHFYDSLGRGTKGHPEVAHNIMKYLEEESMDKRKQPLDPTEWEQLSRMDIPQQQNGSDCGVFACKFADFAARRAAITFDQTHMPYYRKRMVYQLCQSDLSAH